MANNDLVNSLLKGLDILRVIAENEGPVKLSELSALMGIKPTTAHNLIRTLCARDFLIKDNDNRYSLGPAVADIAQYYQDRGLQQKASTIMQDLVRQLEFSTITFAELIGPEIHLVMRYSPDRPFVLQKPQGQTFQPYANASGLAALAFSEDIKLEQLNVRYPYSEFGSHLWKEEEKLNNFLAQVKKQGYAITPFDTDKTLRIAAPILDKKGKLIAILGSSTPATHAEPIKDKIIKLITEASKKVLG